MRYIHLLITVTISILFLSACCNMDCPDCHNLDEENCACIPDIMCLCSNGILDEGEVEIDCGGKCDPCFECLTNYCTLLSGGTSDQPKTNKKWILENLPNRSMDFHSNGVLYWDIVVAVGKGTWRFDDSDAPLKLIITIDGVISGTWDPNVQTEPFIDFGLKVLTEDLLVIIGDSEKRYYPE